MSGPATPYALMAEFESPEALRNAVHSARTAGYLRIDAYSPFPIEGIESDLGNGDRGVSGAALAGGAFGAIGGFFMQAYSATWDYPIDVGGRPFFSWPAFVPLTFELMVLGAALFGLVGFLISCGLPRLDHPVFAAPDFERATLDRFFLCVRAADPRFDSAVVSAFLASLGPIRVVEVRS